MCPFSNSVNAESQQIDLSLRPSAIDPTQAVSVTWATIAEGQRLEGHVRKVVPFGVFVALDHSRLSGLCHISEVRYRCFQREGSGSF